MSKEQIIPGRIPQINFSEKAVAESKKEKAKKYIEKMIRVFLAAGFITFSHASVERRFQEIIGKDYKAYTEYIGETDEDKREMLEEKASYLEDKYSPEIMSFLIFAHEESQKRKKEITGYPKIEGFEQMRIENDQLKKLWDPKNYPSGTILGNVAKIKFINKVVGANEINKDYEMEERQATASAEGVKEDNIYFYKAKGMNEFGAALELIGALDWAFAHELGHLNDWDASNHLTPEQRLEFFYELSKIFGKSDSLNKELAQSADVRSIGEDTPIKEYIKLKEYWAVLCNNYLTFPEQFFSVASPDEARLIKKWLLKGEEFDVEAAQEERKQIKESIRRSLLEKTRLNLKK
jgi:hypothetical protein